VTNLTVPAGVTLEPGVPRVIAVTDGRLTRNAVKCLACGREIESTHQHDYRTCGCPNGTMVDGGLAYQRWGAVDVAKVRSLCEYGPPAEWVELAAECETCQGRGWDIVRPIDGDPAAACPDCHEGRVLHDVRVPCCPSVRHCRDFSRAGCCWGDDGCGFRTVRAVLGVEPLIIGRFLLIATVVES
jgi:hypothetical protein